MTSINPVTYADFDFTSIPGLVFDLNGADGSRISETGGAVDSWTDAVNGYSFSQATGANKPTRVPNGISFDGGDWLDQATTPNMDLTGNITFIIMATNNDIDAPLNGVILDRTTASTGYAVASKTTGGISGKIGMNFLAVVDKASSVAAFSDGEKIVTMARYDGNFDYFKNTQPLGNQNQTGGSAVSNGSEIMTIGNNRSHTGGFFGTIYRILGWNVALNNATASKVMGVLMNYGGVSNP